MANQTVLVRAERLPAALALSTSLWMALLAWTYAFSPRASAVKSIQFPRRRNVEPSRAQSIQQARYNNCMENLYFLIY